MNPRSSSANGQPTTAMRKSVSGVMVSPSLPRPGFARKWPSPAMAIAAYIHRSPTPESAPPNATPMRMTAAWRPSPCRMTPRMPDGSRHEAAPGIAFSMSALSRAGLKTPTLDRLRCC